MIFKSTFHSQLRAVHQIRPVPVVKSIDSTELEDFELTLVSFLVPHFTLVRLQLEYLGSIGVGFLQPRC